jgi:AsmA family
MKAKTRKRLIRFILLPVICLILLVCTAVLILFTQQQRLVNLAVKEINKQLPGELLVSGSDISLLQNYPYISIGLKNVQFFADKFQTTKPIFEAERMFVGFSLPDILKQQYRIKVIFLKNGHLDLVQDNQGKFNILEASRSAKEGIPRSDTASRVLDLDVKKVVLKNINISYADKGSGQLLYAHIDKIQSSISIEQQKLFAGLQGGMLLDYVRPGYTSLLRHKKLTTELKFSYDLQSKMLLLSEGKLNLEDALFNISGSADLLHDNTVDIKFSGDKPDFKQLFSFAPEALAKELGHFKYDGHLSFEGTVKGKIKRGEQPLIETSFSCKSAWLHNTAANKKLDSLAFKGYYTNGPGHCLQTSELRLLDMYARPGEGVFRGNFVLRDFTDPKVLMQIRSDLELGFVGAFLGIKDLQRITGHISLRMDLRELVDLNLPGQSMGELTEGIQSELKVTNLSFRIPAYPYPIEHMNLHANMKSGMVTLDTLSFNVGSSDFHMVGSLSDLPALFHHRQRPVTLSLRAGSNKLILKELMAYDTARSRKAKEEIYGFNIGLSLETSVDELLHPKPLPKGNLKIENLCASFKRYPHAFHDFGAQLSINDTAVQLRDFSGQIDSSDLRIRGRVTNYALWFDKVRRGKTQVAFDLKSQRLAINDLLGRKSRNFVPKDYQQEIASNLWLRSKIDLRYDSVFKFANIKIANISGSLKNHSFQLDSIRGNIKFGVDHFVKIDTLRGKIGRSDFDLSMRLYAGDDTIRRKKENFLTFSSRFLDVDQLTNYYLSAEEDSADSISSPANPAGDAVQTKGSSHADAFNIFKIPFIDFNAAVNVGKIKYNHLVLKNFFSNIRMEANQRIYLDTLGLEMIGGRINAKGDLNGNDPNKIYLRSRICVEDINIEKLMLKLDYFGQDYVINKNIKGSLSGQIESYVQVHPDLTPLIDQSEAKLDLEIINGSLINFGPMHAISSYFKDKNLNMVRFEYQFFAGVYGDFREAINGHANGILSSDTA